MTTAVLSPLRKQGDVSKVLAAPTAVLLQGSSAPPTATTPRTQGSSTSPTATLACTQGSSTSLPDTLAHSYTPIVHMDPLLASIKGRSRALIREGRRAGGWADELAPSLSPSRTLVTPTASASPWRRITRAAVFPPFMFHLAPTHLGWGTQRQFCSSVQGPPPPGVKTPTVGAPGRGLLRVDEQLLLELQMGSLQQPLQPRTLLRYGSLEFMSLDGSYDMVLLPPQRDSDNGDRQLARRRRTRRCLPPVVEEQHPDLSRRLPRRRRRRQGNRGRAGGDISSAVERVDDASTLAKDLLGVSLAPETTTSVVSPQHANPKRTDDASTLAEDLLGISLVPEIMVQSVPDATPSPSIDREVPSVFHPVPFRFSLDPPSDLASVSTFVKAYPNLPGYHMWSTWDRLTVVSNYGPRVPRKKTSPTLVGISLGSVIPVPCETS
jgi:hypothetical protein